MRRRLSIAGLLFLALSVVPAWAQPVQAPAQEDIDDEDSEPALPSGAMQGNGSAERVVEVARGAYVKTEPVVFDYLGVLPGIASYPFGVGLATGHGMRLLAGGDVLTGERIGLSAEVAFWQVVNKALVPRSPSYLHQGPTRSYLFEVAARPTVILGASGRFNLYLKGGLGVCFLEGDINPAEMTDPTLYSSFTYGLNPKPFAAGGAGLEYYTRLSHFSFTFFEVDVLYVMGVDLALGVNLAGVKYTF